MVHGIAAAIVRRMVDAIDHRTTSTPLLITARDLQSAEWGSVVSLAGSNPAQLMSTLGQSRHCSVSASCPLYPPHADAAILFLFSPDDHRPIDSAAILCMCDADPLRPVQQQIGAMHSRIGPLL